jgi:NitT/TauT family transport system permease protein
MAGPVARVPRSRTSLRRAIVAIVASIILWELGSRSEQLIGFRLPWIGVIPPPSRVVLVWSQLVGDPGYWLSWVMSFKRVMSGFLAAVILGIPLGLLMALNRTFFSLTFPVFEILRPIPPLAWVPAAIIFWPTTELSIAFVTFIGAFYTIVINVIGGAHAIDGRFFEAARSMGATSANIFRRIILPGVMPSIMVGCTVGLGITWEVVVAAEMISGGSSSKGGAGGGLGHFIWSSYLGGSYEQIIVGMISIGIAGYLSSGAVRRIGSRLTPWIDAR